MKKFLLPENVNWYRANLHCHSTYSDGTFTPKELKEIYKKEGYSIIAFSDHEILLDHSHLDDKDFLALTSVEYAIGDINGDVGIYTPPDKKYNFRYQRTVHINLFAKNQHNTFAPAQSPKYFWGNARKYIDEAKMDGYDDRAYTVDSVNEVIKRANENGFLVQFNHPYWSLNQRDMYINLKGLWSFEIFNYQTEMETGCEYAPYAYDDMLNSGMKLFCTMGDDNHNGNRIVENMSFGGSTMFGAESLTYENIIDSMEKGNFYSTMGPKINALYIEDGKVKIDFSPCDHIFYNGYMRTNKNIHGKGITHAEFDINPDDVFFRITVRDKYGKNANTNAYFIKDYLD